MTAARETFAVECVDEVVTLVAVQGVTHGPDAGRLAALLDSLIGDGRRKLVVDLRASPLLNSKLLDTLVQTSSRLDPRDGHGLAVVTQTDYVATMLEIGASGGLLLLAGSREEAVEALADLG